MRYLFFYLLPVAFYSDLILTFEDFCLQKLITAHCPLLTAH